MDPRILELPIASVDTHVHSRFSIDSKAEPTAMVAAARAVGLKALVLSEHAEFHPSITGYGFYDAGSVRDSIDSLRAAHPDLAIFRGIEITYLPECHADIRTFLEEQRFDYALGSIHLVDGLDLSIEEAQDAFFRGRSQVEAYGRYFEALEQLASCGLFDGLAHLDLCKRYGHLHYGPMDSGAFEGRIRRILEIMRQAGLVLELNSSGLRQAPGEPYPSLNVARTYLCMGGRVRLGSDAHRYEHVGHRFAELATALAVDT
jgi:histidinol-phosphatase (PHP family)